MLQVHLLTPAMQQFVIWDSLTNRMTSRRGDESLCLAILLGLSVEELLSAKREDRICKYWSLHVHGVPDSVLFVLGEHLKAPGFGWAPANIMKLVGISRRQVCGQITP